MSTQDPSTYATVNPEQNGGPNPQNPGSQGPRPYQPGPYNYPPQYPYRDYPPQSMRRPPRRSSTGLVLGCFALLIMVFGGGFLLFCLVLAQVSGSFSDIASAPSDESLTEKFVSGSRNAKDKIAVLTIDGIITGSEDSYVARQIRRILRDQQVKAVVLRVDSPGGTMSGSDYYYHLLKKMKKERSDLPIVVSMGSIAASGGYYVSMVGDEIYAERSTITGSIGVIASLYDATELARKVGVEATPITSGPHKSMGSMMLPMSEEEKAIWQRLIDDNFERFKEVIREGRQVFAKDPESLDQLATGQIYTATEAEASQLIDRIGFIDDAITSAMMRAGLNEKNARVIKYKTKATFMEVLLDAQSSANVLGTKTLQELTTPRIYLLCPYVLPIGGER